MFFIGQPNILNVLGVILPHLYETKEGHAFLLRGPSGFGKTELSLKICNYLSGTEYSYCLGNKIRIPQNIWVQFIDEIHLCQEPEILYPYIDSNKHVFVFATNHDSVLQEALVNRCTNLLFTDYTDEELIEIFRKHCRMDFPDEVIRHIIAISGRNPRIMIKTYAESLYLYFLHRRNEYKVATVHSIIDLVNRLHNIDNGLPPGPKRYIELLETLGGKSSLNLLASMLHLDVETVKRDIEPFLLLNGMIKITSKGRILCKSKL